MANLKGHCCLAEKHVHKLHTLVICLSEMNVPEPE